MTLLSVTARHITAFITDDRVVQPLCCMKQNLYEEKEDVEGADTSLYNNKTK